MRWEGGSVTTAGKTQIWNGIAVGSAHACAPATTNIAATDTTATIDNASLQINSAAQCIR